MSSFTHGFSVSIGSTINFGECMPPAGCLVEPRSGECLMFLVSRDAFYACLAKFPEETPGVMAL